MVLLKSSLCERTTSSLGIESLVTTVATLPGVSCLPPEPLWALQTWGTDTMIPLHPSSPPGSEGQCPSPPLFMQTDPCGAAWPLRTALDGESHQVQLLLK